MRILGSYNSIVPRSQIRINADKIRRCGLANWMRERDAIDLTADRLGVSLTQMFVVANVVRHGEGQSCDRLRALAPNCGMMPRTI